MTTTTTTTTMIPLRIYHGYDREESCIETMVPIDETIPSVLKNLDQSLFYHKLEISTASGKSLILPPLIHNIEKIQVTRSFTDITKNFIHEDDTLLNYFNSLCRDGAFTLPVEKKMDALNVCGIDISFQRTLRIPESPGKTYPLPPSLGYFHLYKVSDYKDKVPKDWNKDGYFFSMYQNEALWINFDHHHSSKAVKVGLGTVNALTGKRMEKGLSCDRLGESQDYLVLPEQPWIDGVNSGDGYVRQFVAVPLGIGASVEGQITGREDVGGFTFEVYPPLCDGTCDFVDFYSKMRNYHYSDRDRLIHDLTKTVGSMGFVPDKDVIYMENHTVERKPILRDYLELAERLYGEEEENEDGGLVVRLHKFTHVIKKLNITTLTGRTLRFNDVPTSITIFGIKKMVEDREGIPTNQVRLILYGKQLNDEKYLGEYYIMGDTIDMQLVLGLRGGGGDVSRPKEMGLAVGGRIKQKIYEDKDPLRWNTSFSTGQIHVYILNSHQFKEVTGEDPDPPTITIRDYILRGFPWFDLYDEKIQHVKGTMEGKLKTVDKFIKEKEEEEEEDLPEVKDEDVIMIL